MAINDNNDKKAISSAAAEDLCNRAGMRYISYGKKLQNGTQADETEVKHDMFLLYLEGSANGHPRAAYNVGVCYHFGFGVGTDFSLAKSYYTLAMSQNYSAAYVYMARMYMQGEGVCRDEQKAQELLEEAAALGNPCACFMLGGSEANRKNPDKALSYFKKAAERYLDYTNCVDMRDAMSGLDYECVRDGIGRSMSKCLFFAAYLTILILRKKEDFSTAVKWLNLALDEMDMPEPLIVLAHCYTYGEGVERDFEMADSYVKRAEEAGLHGAEEAKFDLEDAINKFKATNQQ